MDRLACVSIPAFELQLLIRRNPHWQDLPAVVISESKPLGRVIAANRSALKSGVRPDMRYAQALSLRPDLQAAVISPQERGDSQEEIRALLYEFAPSVESPALPTPPFSGSMFVVSPGSTAHTVAGERSFSPL